MRAILLAVAVALAAAATAAAAPTPGKGNTRPQGCNGPTVAVVLTGTFAQYVSAQSFTMNVFGGNVFAKAYKGQPALPIAVSSSTAISRQGDHNLAHFVHDDRLNVQARVCRASLANHGTPALTASRVTGRPGA